MVCATTTRSCRRMGPMRPSARMAGPKRAIGIGTTAPTSCRRCRLRAQPPSSLPAFREGSFPPHVWASPNDKISHNVHTNFGPRFGFAYKATDQTVIHGAFGIVYDNWAAVTQLVQNAEGSWPDIGDQLSTPTTTNVPSTASPTPTVASQNPFGSAPGNCTRLPPHMERQRLVLRPQL